MIRYIIGAHGNEALITKYTKCHKQNDMSHLYRKWKKKFRRGLFYILTILKSFLIEIRLTAGGGNGFFWNRNSNQNKNEIGFKCFRFRAGMNIADSHSQHVLIILPILDLRPLPHQIKFSSDSNCKNMFIVLPLPTSFLVPVHI